MFLAHAGAAAQALAVERNLDETLERMVVAAHAAWPDVHLPEATFLAHVAERLSTADDSGRALGAIHAPDLYLACGCTHGDAQALLAFERQYMSEVSLYIGASPETAPFADEVKQDLRVRLLMGADGDPPRIAAYNGHGPLGGWLRMAAVRTAIDLRRARARRERREEEEPLLRLMSADPDPELRLIKRDSRLAFEAAFKSTLAALEPREANVLRLYFLHGMTPEAIGRLNKCTGRTVNRWIAKAREKILAETRAQIDARLSLSTSQLGGVMELIESQLDVSVRKFLGDPGSG